MPDRDIFPSFSKVDKLCSKKMKSHWKRSRGREQVHTVGFWVRFILIVVLTLYSMAPTWEEEIFLLFLSLHFVCYVFNVN